MAFCWKGMENLLFPHLYMNARERRSGAYDRLRYNQYIDMKSGTHPNCLETLGHLDPLTRNNGVKSLRCSCHGTKIQAPRTFTIIRVYFSVYPKSLKPFDVPSVRRRYPLHWFGIPYAPTSFQHQIPPSNETIRSLGRPSSSKIRWSLTGPCFRISSNQYNHSIPSAFNWTPSTTPVLSAQTNIPTCNL
jgi:hypothetical protein